jgi:hypothetical protein
MRQSRNFLVAKKKCEPDPFNSLGGRFLFITISFFKIEFFYSVNVQIAGLRAFAQSRSNAGLGHCPGILGITL